MKRIKKRVTALLLSCFLAFSGVAGSYQTAQAAEIVAGYTIGQILESILLSFGISIFTTEMIQKGTNATWWDTDGSAALKPYYDDLEQAYEEQRFKVINGSGGQNPEPSPTPAPGTTPIPFPTTVPVPGDIPTFQELVAPALAGTAAFIDMTQGAWECMAEAVSSLWNKMMGRVNDVDSAIPEDQVDIIMSKGYPYYVYYQYTNGKFYLSLYGLGSFAYKNSSGNGGSLLAHGYCNYYNGKFAEENKTASLSVSLPYKDLSSYASNIPMFSTFQEGSEWASQQLANADKYVKENIWVHPDLQNTYQNNGKLEYPQQAPQPLQIPSGDQLADLSKKLNPEINTEFAPEMAPNYIQELIQQLQKGLNPDPDPDPDPNPNPNPNPDPDPDPNPNPNPDPDPDPDPNPTGSPDPEPTKAPEEDSSSDVDPKDYAIDLRKIFPFCIPFDLIHLLNVLDAEPEAPRFEIPIDLEADNPFSGKKIVDYHTKIVIDMSDYEQPIKVIRIFEIMFFILALLLITRDQMIKG